MVLCLLLSLTISACIGWAAIHAFDLKSRGAVVALFVLCLMGAIPLFASLVDLGHRIEIRLFCRKHGLEVKRIRAYPNHFGVDYVEDGVKKYGKWPGDFEVYVE